MADDTKRIALVTGANKGIGLAIAHRLAESGALVLLGARDDARGEAAVDSLRTQGLDAKFIKLDLDDIPSIETAAKSILEAHGRLDILVNNAGVTDAGDGPTGEASVDAVRRIFDTNFFGAIAVTQAMLPLMRKSAAGRIVNVSSGLGSLTLNSDPSWEFAGVKPLGYNTSKAALNMMTVVLAAELRETGIKVNAADPGYTKTDLNGNSGYQTVEQGAAAAVRLALLPNDGPTGGFFSADREEPW